MTPRSKHGSEHKKLEGQYRLHYGFPACMVTQGNASQNSKPFSWDVLMNNWTSSQHFDALRHIETLEHTHKRLDKMCFDMNMLKYAKARKHFELYSLF